MTERRQDRAGQWSLAEEKALAKHASAPEQWSAQQIASLLHREGFPLRSRSAILGRLCRDKISLKARPAHAESAYQSTKKRREVRRAFLDAMGGVEPERHSSDRKPKGKAKPKTDYRIKRKGEAQARAVPDVSVFKKHALAPVGSRKLATLGVQHCRFPFGLEAPFKFCGAPVAEGSYCEKHYKLTHQR